MIDKTAGGELGTRCLFLYNYFTHPSLFVHDTAVGQQDTDRDGGKKIAHLILLMENALAVKWNDAVSINFTTAMLTTGIALLIPR